MQISFQGISFKLARAGFLLALFLGFLLLSLLLYTDYQWHLKAQNRLIEMIISNTQPAAIRAVHTLDSELANEVISGLLSYPSIHYVRITDEQGNVLAESSHPLYAVDEHPFNRLLDIRSSYHEVPLQVPGFDSAATGTLAFKVDPSVMREGFINRAMLLAIGGLLHTFLLLFSLFVAFYWLLTKPLIRMVNEIGGINPALPEKRRLTVPARNENDELGQLIQTSNHMLDTIESALYGRLDAENQVRDSEKMIREVVNNLPAIVGVFNKNGRVIFCNQYMANFYGTTIEQLQGSLITDFDFIRQQGSDMDKFLTEPLTNDKAYPSFQGYYFSADSVQHYMEGAFRHLILQNQDCILMVANDITERKSAEERMKFMAYHDALTQLPNRYLLVDRLENELRRAKRHNQYGAILFIDLDHFKTINDSLGHPAGDFVLKIVAKRLRESVRDEDLVARLSGDEFVVVLTLLDSDLESAAVKAGEVAEKIRRIIAEPYSHDSMKLHISCSVGIVVYSHKDESVHELLRFADTAMYQVKEKGRDAIEFFNLAMADRVSRRLVMEGELHRAIEEQQFELFYQSKVNADDGRIIGAEALIRWRHPVEGLISPAEFIPVLEASGLIVEVGQWVIEEACQVLTRWQAAGCWPPGMQLSVNISPRQFRRRSFVKEVEWILQSNPIPPGSLDMEITENVVIHNADEAIETMAALRAMGISFSLDDFGTGYSSISYLKRLPVSTLKIDREFIRDITEDGNDRVLVQTVITMGNLLGLQVVAEGVETDAQVAILREFECDSFQGFLFCVPLPEQEFEQLLDNEMARSH